MGGGEPSGLRQCGGAGVVAAHGRPRTDMAAAAHAGGAGARRGRARDVRAVRAGCAGPQVHHAGAQRRALAAHERAARRALHSRRGGAPKVAYGRDQAGRALAAQSAAHPLGLNEAVAGALAAAVGAARGGPTRAHPADPDTRAPGGRLVDGAELAGDVCAAVEAARHTPAPFASVRNLVPEEEGRLARSSPSPATCSHHTAKTIG
eukprot:83423-Pleurochrysis_carterae.AAC.2